MQSLIKVLLLVGVLFSSVSQAQVTGAGATFPAPLYSGWSVIYKKETNKQVNYQSIGSGAGIKQIQGKTVDFGASDMPLKDEELSKFGLLQFPTAIGGVVPVINIPGIKSGELKLTGKILGDIYLGKITKWNDPQLVALNPAIKLPDAAIAPVRRSDGSGTTFIFTNYLSKVNDEWKTRVGEGTAVNWPLGVDGKGNEGVAAFVGRLKYSIGYVEYSYVKQSTLTYVQLQNKAGVFLNPTEASFKAASASADWSRSFYQILTDQPGKEAWPMTGATFIIVYVQPENTEKMSEVLSFFNWAYKTGDPMATQLGYVPLPESVKNLSRQAWGRIKKDGASVPFK